MNSGHNRRAAPRMETQARGSLKLPQIEQILCALSAVKLPPSIIISKKKKTKQNGSFERLIKISAYCFKLKKKILFNQKLNSNLHWIGFWTQKNVFDLSRIQNVCGSKSYFSVLCAPGG